MSTATLEPTPVESALDLAELIEIKLALRARNRGRMMFRTGESIPLQPPKWIKQKMLRIGRLAAAYRISYETEGWRIAAANVDPRAETERIVRRGKGQA